MNTRLDVTDPAITGLPEFRAWRTVIQWLHDSTSTQSRRAAAALRSSGRADNSRQAEARIEEADSQLRDANAMASLWARTSGAYEQAKHAVHDGAVVNDDNPPLYWLLLEHFRLHSTHYLNSNETHVPPRDEFYRIMEN